MFRFGAQVQQTSAERPAPREPLLHVAAGWLWATLAAAFTEYVWQRVPVRVRALVGAVGALPVGALVLHRNRPETWPLALPLGALVAFAAWWRVRPRGALQLPLTRRVLPRRWIAPGAALGASALLGAVWALGERALTISVLVEVALAVSLSALVWRAPAPEKRPGRDPAEVIAAWPEITAPGTPLARALGGSTVSLATHDAVSWTLGVELVPGRTLHEVVALTSNLESAIRVARGSLRISADEMAHRCFLRVMTRDQLRASAGWPEPTATSVLEPIVLGPFEDGEPARLPLVPAPGQGISVLIGGLPGSGKSSVLNVIVGALAGCRDVVLAGIDPQSTELGPWSAVFEPGFLALDAGPDSSRLLAGLEAAMDARTAWMGRMGVRAWSPSPENPEIVLIADEFADLTRDMARLSRLARAGRKAGIHAVMATQRPSMRALGDWGGELRALFGSAICLRVSSVVETNLILGPGAAGEGWRPDRVLKRPGEFLISSSDPVHGAPRRGRCYLVDDAAVRRRAAACAPLRSRLDQLSAAAAADARERA